MMACNQKQDIGQRPSYSAFRGVFVSYLQVSRTGKQDPVGCATICNMPDLRRELMEIEKISADN
jgi:hypothetical protein